MADYSMPAVPAAVVGMSPTRVSWESCQTASNVAQAPPARSSPASRSAMIAVRKESGRRYSASFDAA
jgi:hypothetical protein